MGKRLVAGCVVVISSLLHLCKHCLLWYSHQLYMYSGRKGNESVGRGNGREKEVERTQVGVAMVGVWQWWGRGKDECGSNERSNSRSLTCSTAASPRDDGQSEGAIFLFLPSDPFLMMRPRGRPLLPQKRVVHGTRRHICGDCTQISCQVHHQSPGTHHKSIIIPEDALLPHRESIQCQHAIHSPSHILYPPPPPFTSTHTTLYLSSYSRGEKQLQLQVML